ncbi:squalene synthase HpnC [Phenylobacterium montanum]|uniref:Squalene synthase HpnC n=1 Tax=Phenylobacterium montanum TaxID=2823693 RepID=A0A975FYS8_9CAUL|nr:squalene synthase HpnC [Caulobacter sp. S6]QUD87905.1 squalene synthase HpnC [Caulobacter sp. S6]
MTNGADFTSGKDHTNENFPVGSFLIAARHRPVVMAFYRVARQSDDIADHPGLAPVDKLAALKRIEDSLLGKSTEDANAVALRQVLAERGLTDQHALDLLEAFRCDATKQRYADWAELMDYCRYSAAPVGRFMLDVHGEDRATWPASDALCAALQVINHLQDCAEDYREMNRVYVPLDALAEAGLGVEALAEPKSTPALRSVIDRLTRRTDGLLQVSRALAPQVKDAGIGLEVAVIQSIAEAMTRKLLRCDPLAERAKLDKPQQAAAALKGVGAFALIRMGLGKGVKLSQTGAP